MSHRNGAVASGVDVLEQQGLPSSPDTERIVLGSVVNYHAESWPEASATLTDSDFTVEVHRRLWHTVATMSRRGEVIDLVTVSEALSACRELETIGGASFLIDLAHDIPRIINIGAYCKILRHKSKMRRLILAGQQLINRAALGDLDTADLSDWAERVAAEANAEDERTLRRADEIITEDPEGFYDPSTRAGNGVWLPWRSLRALIPALMPGKLILLAARPAMGKSSAAFQIGLEAARRGLPVAGFSLEMPARDILGRLACGLARVDSNRWRRGMLSEEEMDSFRRATATIGELPFYLDDSASATVPGVLAAIERLAVKPRLVIVDYLQLMSGPGENRTNEVSRISRDLKKAAMRLEIPFLVLSQLTRENQRAGRAPELSDLRDSGSLEQDADDVMFLHSASFDMDAPALEVRVLVKKQRNGPVGAKTLLFQRAFTWFEEVQEA